MEFYMKKAAQEDLLKPLKHCKDEMPPTSSLKPPSCKPMASTSYWCNFENSTCVFTIEMVLAPVGNEQLIGLHKFVFGII